MVILSILIAFYSRTGRTKKIAELISNRLNCDYEEIVDMKKRTGRIYGVSMQQSGITDIFSSSVDIFSVDLEEEAKQLLELEDVEPTITE